MAPTAQPPSTWTPGLPDVAALHEKFKSFVRDSTLHRLQLLLTHTHTYTRSMGGALTKPHLLFSLSLRTGSTDWHTSWSVACYTWQGEWANRWLLGVIHSETTNQKQPRIFFVLRAKPTLIQKESPRLKVTGTKIDKNVAWILGQGEHGQNSWTQGFQKSSSIKN